MGVARTATVLATAIACAASAGAQLEFSSLGLQGTVESMNRDLELIEEAVSSSDLLTRRLSIQMGAVERGELDSAACRRLQEELRAYADTDFAAAFERVIAKVRKLADSGGRALPVEAGALEIARMRQAQRNRMWDLSRAQLELLRKRFRNSGIPLEWVDAAEDRLRTLEKVQLEVPSPDLSGLEIVAEALDKLEAMVLLKQATVRMMAEFLGHVLSDLDRRKAAAMITSALADNLALVDWTGEAFASTNWMLNAAGRLPGAGLSPVRLTTDKARYAPGEEMQFALTVANAGHVTIFNTFTDLGRMRTVQVYPADETGRCEWLDAGQYVAETEVLPDSEIGFQHLIVVWSQDTRAAHDAYRDCGRLGVSCQTTRLEVVR